MTVTPVPVEIPDVPEAVGELCGLIEVATMEVVGIRISVPLEILASLLLSVRTRGLERIFPRPASSMADSWISSRWVFPRLPNDRPSAPPDPGPTAAGRFTAKGAPENPNAPVSGVTVLLSEVAAPDGIAEETVEDVAPPSTVTLWLPSRAPHCTPSCRE